MSNAPVLTEASRAEVFELQRIINTYDFKVWADGHESMVMIITPDLLPLVTSVISPDEIVHQGQVTLWQDQRPTLTDVVMVSFKTGGDWLLEIPLTEAEEKKNKVAERHKKVNTKYSVNFW